MSTGLCGSEPYIAPEQFVSKRKSISSSDLLSKPHDFLLPRLAYDARLVDIWACGIVYYCLHFQELPWRAAQAATDTLYAAYAQACANPLPAVSSCPQTINNLSPRACRSLIRRMLEPDPRRRATIEEVMKHSWIQEIAVCYETAKPRHVHVSARAMANAHLGNAG
jgi:protein-serine/threonine kinase